MIELSFRDDLRLLLLFFFLPSSHLPPPQIPSLLLIGSIPPLRGPYHATADMLTLHKAIVISHGNFRQIPSVIEARSLNEPGKKLFPRCFPFLSILSQ